MGRELDCLRCGTRMNYIRREKFQMGEAGWLLGDLPHLIKGAMELDVYSCPFCGKVEFFQVTGDGEVSQMENPGNGETEFFQTMGEELPQVKCPVCGKVHDFDYGRCPFCKHEY